MAVAGIEVGWKGGKLYLMEEKLYSRSLILPRKLRNVLVIQYHYQQIMLRHFLNTLYQIFLKHLIGNSLSTVI